jgi:hypothetical protein
VRRHVRAILLSKLKHSLGSILSHTERSAIQ